MYCIVRYSFTPWVCFTVVSWVGANKSCIWHTYTTCQKYCSNHTIALITHARRAGLSMSTVVIAWLNQAKPVTHTHHVDLLCNRATTGQSKVKRDEGTPVQSKEKVATILSCSLTISCLYLLTNVDHYHIDCIVDRSF